MLIDSIFEGKKTADCLLTRGVSKVPKRDVVVGSVYIDRMRNTHTRERTEKKRGRPLRRNAA